MNFTLLLLKHIVEVFQILLSEIYAYHLRTLSSYQRNLVITQFYLDVKKRTSQLNY